MSNLLKEAIVDAKALKEAALRNAEAAVIDKYSAEVKQTLEALLEQEEELSLEEPPADLGAETEDLPADLGADLGLGDEEVALDGEEMEGEEVADIVPDVPLSAADGVGIGAETEGTPVEFSVDLQALQEAVAELEGELTEDEEFDISEVVLAALLEGKGKHDDGDGKDEKCDYVDCGDDADEPEVQEEGAGNAPGAPEDAGSFAGEEADEEEDENDSAAALAGSTAATNAADAAQRGAFQENMDIEALVDAIMEKLTVDMGATLSGWGGRSSESMKYEIERALAQRRSTGEKEELDTLRQAQEELVFENNQLTEKLTNYEQAVGQLKENLQEVNLSNARLLYTNRILRNTSLNERQKEKIVEAISNAGSVTEARTIFDTLESTVQSAPKRGPQSLGEAITRRSSVIRATRKESTPSDPLAERMKRLAGIE